MTQEEIERIESTQKMEEIDLRGFSASLKKAIDDHEAATQTVVVKQPLDAPALSAVIADLQRQIGEAAAMLAEANAARGQLSRELDAAQRDLARMTKLRDRWQSGHNTINEIVHRTQLELSEAQRQRDEWKDAAGQWEEYSKQGEKRLSEAMQKLEGARDAVGHWARKHGEAEAKKEQFAALSEKLKETVEQLATQEREAHSILDAAGISSEQPALSARVRLLADHAGLLRQNYETCAAELNHAQGDRRALMTQVTAATAALDRVCPQKDGSLQNKVEWALREISAPVVQSQLFVEGDAKPAAPQGYEYVRVVAGTCNPAGWALLPTGAHS